MRNHQMKIVAIWNLDEINTNYFNNHISFLPLYLSKRSKLIMAIQDLVLKSILNASKAKKVICALVVLAAVLSISSTTPALKEISDKLPRRLSQYFGDGHCLWTPPTYDVPENITFTKTLVAGFPSGDKRLTFVQMEALTGLSARDEWDFAYLVSDRFLSTLLLTS